MKVIKRDGRAVDYDRRKIEIAIGKANREVPTRDMATKQEIEEIVNYIEALDRKRMLVEDIQDIIEQQLMEVKKYNLAKKYIVYRYTRALVRKQNTTDESILGIIRNENSDLSENKLNKNTILSSSQRDYIAGEVSKDLTKRLLLPEKITKADEEGILHFHDADYFIQPIINSSNINLKDILENGTIINGYEIKSPQNFNDACQVLVDIILDVSNNQYGMQYIDISCLGKYILNKMESEIIYSLELIKQHLNAIVTNGKKANVTFLINLNKDEEYFKERTTISNIINKISLANNKNIFVKIINEKTLLNSFDQGKVTINLVQAAIVSNNNENIFFEELNNRLELCREALMYKHYALLGTKSDTSPILWQNGGLARLQKGEKIDELLKNGISTLSLGFIGIIEILQLIKVENKDIFKEKILKTIMNYVKVWSKETGIKFIINSENKKEISSKFLKIDKEKFGVIPGVTDKEYYEL